MLFSKEQILKQKLRGYSTEKLNTELEKCKQEMVLNKPYTEKYRYFKHLKVMLEHVIKFKYQGS